MKISTHILSAFFCVTLVMLAATTFAQAPVNSYVKVFGGLEPIVGDLSTVNDKKRVAEKINYVDDLGRQYQSIYKQGSKSGSDVVAITIYDSLGRLAKKYLPFVSGTDGSMKASPLTTQAAFYQSMFPGTTDGQYPYGVDMFETSELNRVIKEGAPGTAWQPNATDNSYTSSDHTTRNSYGTNGDNEVMMLKYVPPFTGNVLGAITYGNSRFYPTGSLSRGKTKDQNGNESIDYTTRDGKVILKSVQVDATTYAQTYYVYNSDGTLAVVIQPEGSKMILAEALSVTAINWTSTSSVSVSGTTNDITKTGSIGYSTGAAISSEQLAAGMDGWVEMKAIETNKNRMIGLGSTNNPNTTIPYAIEFTSLGHVRAWESSSVWLDMGTYTTGTRVRLAREGTAIKYYLNGVLKRISINPSSTNLMIDMALSDVGATISGVNASFSENSIMQTALTNFAFVYVYDGRGRMTQKVVPGAAVSYMVYDDRDRLVMTQDGNLRKSPGNSDLKKWWFTKYDTYNRPVLTGIITVDSVLDQTFMQKRVDRYYKALATNGGAWFETFVGSTAGNVHGYSNLSFPLTSVVDDYLTVNYYDSYSFLSLLGTGFNYVDENLTETVNGVVYNQPDNNFAQVVTKVTGTKVKVLDPTVNRAAIWLPSVTYYDDHHQVIQTISANFAGGKDRTTTLFDFNNKVLEMKNVHYNTWRDRASVSVTEDRIVRQQTQGWSAGATSVAILQTGADGWVEFTVPDITSNFMIGLSDINPDASYQSIAYAIYVNSAALQIYEKGTSRGTKGSALVAGQTLRVSRTGTTVTYLQGSTVVYTSTLASTTPLMVDCSVNSTAATIPSIKMSFGPLTRTISRRFEYDHGGRLLKLRHQIDANPEVQLSQSDYNELGQLLDKKVHSTDGTTFKQSQDYRYNIRGWQTSMNNASLQPDANLNDDSNDYFGYELGYNVDPAALGALPTFNGNISSIRWSNNLGLSNVKKKGYKYSYDAMNRLLGADYMQETGGAWAAAPNSGFSESGYSYDLNGNIKTLIRYDVKGSTAPMDNLTYNYGAAPTLSNRLLKVSEVTGTGAGNKFKGFIDGVNTSNDYTYDFNGNMITDLNNGIPGNITYNHLNQPVTISKGGSQNTLTYVYDANGRKLAQLITFYTSLKRSDYHGEFQYENDALQFITHDEGRAVMTTRTTVYSFDGSALSDVTTNNVTVDTVRLNGNQKYMQVTPSGTVATSGVYPMGQALNVVTGEKYKIRVHGYRTGSSAVFILAKLNGNLINFQVAAISNSADADMWTELEVVATTNGTLQAGVAWNTVVATDRFYVNDFEIVKVAQNAIPEYQYHMKDHLGNVRLTYTTKQETESVRATLEAANQNADRAEFINYDKARRINAAIFDHTNGYGTAAPTGYSARLNGSDQERIGLSRSISVMPGDKIQMRVFAKYADPVGENGADPAWQAVASLLTSIHSGAAGVVVDGIGYATSSYSQFPFMGDLDKSSETGSTPMAYLNYIAFDRNFKPILDATQSNFKRISVAARENGADGPHEELYQEITIKEAGYVYVYLSNDNPTAVDVFFDDFEVNQIKGGVVQMDDYYPFGMTFNSYRKENSIANQYQYNGKETQDEFNLRWSDYGARMYMPEIGRLMAVDPLSEKTYSVSPYAYALNSPINFVDGTGKVPVPVIYLVYEGLVFAFTATVSYYIVTNEHLSNGLFIGDGPALLAATKRGEGYKYWKELTARTNRKGIPLFLGQPKGNDLEPPPNPKWGQYKMAAIGFTALYLLADHQDYIQLLVKRLQQQRNLSKDRISLVNKEIDDALTRYGNLSWDNPEDRAELSELTDRTDLLGKLKLESEDQVKAIDGALEFLNYMKNIGTVKADAVRRSSDSMYSPEFLRWYYGHDEEEQDENDEEQ
ncbi:MAG: DUF6443 domain-containing protein [Bacteroidota bacterium]